MEFIPGRPILSAKESYVTNPNELMAICFKDFLITDYSQTTTLRGEICSLKYILSKYIDKSEIRDSIKNTLYKLYSNYFENVIVMVEMDDTTSTVNYTINIAGYQNNVQYILSQVISESNKEILNFDEIIYDLRKVLKGI